MFQDPNNFTGTLHTNKLDKAEQQPGKHVQMDLPVDAYGFGSSLKGVIRDNKVKYENKHGYVLSVTFFTDANNNPLDHPVTHTTTLMWLKPLKKGDKIPSKFIDDSVMQLPCRPGKEFEFDEYFEHK